MTRKNNRKTPLGDKFEETDFPIEPRAWSEMTDLLAAQSPKGPLSIFGKFGFFIASIPLVLIAFWQLSSEFSRDKKTQQMVAETAFSQDKKAAKSGKDSIELNDVNSKKVVVKLSSTVDKISLELNKTTLKREELTLNSTNKQLDLITNKKISVNAKLLGTEDNKTALKTRKKALKSNDLALNSINNETNLMTNKNALMNTQLSVHSVDNKQLLEGNKAVLMNENVIKNELINKNGQTINQPLLLANNSLIHSFNSEKKGELLFDLITKDKSDFAIKNALDSNHANLTKDPLNTSMASNSESIKTSFNNLEIIDNQSVALSENKEIITFLALRELNSIYSDSFQNINNLSEISALLPTSLIPISQLWRGNHHQISVGFGHASLEFNNRDRPAINRFRLAYNYRITPLLGIGTSTNYVSINPKGYYSTTELELNLYFINRQRFDAFLSAGYGYRQWDFQNNASETLTGRGRGFTLGLNTQYAINRQYTVAFRIDLKQAVEPDFGFLLVLSRCF